MPTFIDMEIEVLHATAQDKPALQRLMQFYLYDFSEFLNLEMGDNGVFMEGILDSYFSGNETRTPYLIKVNGKLAGFILVSDQVILEESKGAKCIKEFFVMRRYRRAGIGRIALKNLLDSAPSAWEVRVVANNQPAIHFWMAALHQLTNGNFSRRDLNDEQWKGPVFTFQNGIENRA
jgi:predicted acetyltransferase